MIDIPINAKVICSDGTAGASMAVIINPLDRIVTHFSVQDKNSPVMVDRLVPVNLVASTTPETIVLNCTRDEFSALELFNDNHYIQNEEADLEYLEPFMTPLDTRYTAIGADRVPVGELAVRRGTNVEASDGYIGKIEAFIINPDDGHISHMILQQGHLFGKKEVALPIVAIDRMEELTVVLKLSKAEIAELNTIPVKRAWHGSTAVELVVWTYAGKETAVTALNALKVQAKDEKITLLNTAVLTKDSEGKTQINESGDMDGKHGALFGAITGGLVGLLAGPAGVVIGAVAGAATGSVAASWIDMGFSNDDLKALQENLQPDSSAIVVLLEDEGVEEAVNTLAKWEGQQLQQTLTDEMVTNILSKHEQAKADETVEDSEA